MGRGGSAQDVESFLDKIGLTQLENWTSNNHYNIKCDYGLGMRLDHQGVRLQDNSANSKLCR